MNCGLSNGKMGGEEEKEDEQQQKEKRHPSSLLLSDEQMTNDNLNNCSNYYVNVPKRQKIDEIDPLGLRDNSSRKIVNGKDLIKSKKVNPKDPLNLSNNYYKKQNNSEGNKKRAIYRYGNYLQYYGYRNESDERLNFIDCDFVDNKQILDIGCNTGQFTIAIAKKFHPKYIIGIDIDPKLTSLAKKNIQLHKQNGIITSLFPKSLSQTYGALPSGDLSSCDSLLNVSFFSCDFLNFDFGDSVYDTIFALSITKWIHLNWGDEGIINFFQKCHRLLSNTGVLLLEFQPFSSYRKKRNITEEIKKNYQNIKIKPKDFKRIILEEIRFSRVEELKCFNLNASNFDRPFYAIYK